MGVRVSPLERKILFYGYRDEGQSVDRLEIFPSIGTKYKDQVGSSVNLDGDQPLCPETVKG
jgi:hypothetical protein